MAERYFTPEEVEALIPELTRLMEGVIADHREARQLRDRLRAEQQRVVLAGGAVLDQAAWRADAERLQRLTRRIQETLDRILRMGGVPKDLAQGLVDFPYLRDGREVHLCWKFGEEAIRYWHGLDEGYAGRKPLP